MYVFGMFSVFLCVFSGNPRTLQLYGHIRHGGCGVCQEILIQSGTPTTPKRFNSQFTQNIFFYLKKKTKILIITEVKTQLFPNDLKCPECFAN